MVHETVVGRNREDLEKYGRGVVGFIGKHIVGAGEDAHLTTRVLIDLKKPHVILLTGKRGTGKSYIAGVIAEEIALLPEKNRRNLAVVFVDTMGIFWSMKKPNEQQILLLNEWKMKPRAFENVKHYVPLSQVGEFEAAGLPVDGGISIQPHEFSAEEWRIAFNLKATEPVGIALEKTINDLSKGAKGGKFTIEDMIAGVREDEELTDDVRDALVNMLAVAAGWGVFSTEGMNIDDIVVPGEISIVDISHLRATEAWSVRNFMVAILARKIYQGRVIARKGEELEKIGESIKDDEQLMASLTEREEGYNGADKDSDKAETKKDFPMTWLVIDEAHNFAPADSRTVSSEPLSTIAKQGREPGVSMVVITQMPNRLHQDILSQCDIVFSHRLTSRDDLDALHSVMQTYMAKDLWQYINSLPRWPGAAIILDDNMEKVFTVQVRPRYSWHAGGTAALV
jgi:hypothetical protein